MTQSTTLDANLRKMANLLDIGESMIQSLVKEMNENNIENVADIEFHPMKDRNCSS